MIKLIAFLGNPGNKYYNTRHNIAWIVANKIELCHNLQWQSKFKGEYSKLILANDMNIHLLKPHTYMNLSGNSVIDAIQFFKLKPENVLIVHDELEIKPATISLKWSGGLGGHNGLRSIKANLGTYDFWRLRIGIGRPEFENTDIAGYVLSIFSKNELNNIENIIPNLNLVFDEIINAKDQDELKSLLSKWSKCVPK